MTTHNIIMYAIKLLKLHVGWTILTTARYLRQHTIIIEPCAYHAPVLASLIHVHLLARKSMMIIS